MPSDVPGWKRTAAQMMLVNAGVLFFCESVIRHGAKKNHFDGDTLGQFIGDAIRSIKNMDVAGISFEDEADLIGDASKQLETQLSIAVAKGLNV